MQWQEKQLVFWCIFTAGTMNSCWAAAGSQKQMLFSKLKHRDIIAEYQDKTMINQASEESLECSQSASTGIHLNIYNVNTWALASSQEHLKNSEMDPFGNTAAWALLFSFLRLSFSGRGWYPLELALKTPPKPIFFRATKVCVLLWLSSHTNGKLAGSYISLFYSTWWLKVLHTTWLIHPFIPTIISPFKCFQSNIHTLISPVSAPLSLNVQAKTSVLFSSSTFMFLLL